ncbi:MAG: signal peptidase II [Actinomycetota bacterium]
MQTARRTHTLAQRALFITAASALAIDQITKAVAVATLRPHESIPFIGRFWHWTLEHNPGAAFSLFTNVPVLFTILAIAISVAIVWYSFRVPSFLYAIALGLVLGGALGNLTDRIVRSPGVFRGSVIDFIDWRVWPTFNVADACVVCGAALLFIASFRADREAKKT